MAVTKWVAAVVLTGTCLISPASAQSSGDEEIAQLRRQLATLEKKLDKLQKKTDTRSSAEAKTPAQSTASNSHAAIPVKVPASDPIVLMPNNRPTICTAYQQSCVSITSRLHLDVGGYDYRPNTAATAPQRLDDGFNVRRARIGVLGKFLDDWNYALIYDFAGSSDGFAATGSVGGTSVRSLPGGGLSGIENAYLSYTAFLYDGDGDDPGPPGLSAMGLHGKQMA